jgi:hypothetical protein
VTFSPSQPGAVAAEAQARHQNEFDFLRRDCPATVRIRLTDSVSGHHEIAGGTDFTRHDEVALKRGEKQALS